MKYLSVCSGIEAATVAWSGFGWKAIGFSEIEPFPSKVLKHHYPDVPNHGDMTLLPEKIRTGAIEAPDLLCGGTPCQAFSVAGLRRSLDDDRGNLTLKFCEIADAIDETRSVPSIIFWENVPGVLNTKDNAFGCFLGSLAGENAPLIPSGGRWSNAGFVDGPKRAIAWRVLDAQYFGVAQRRRRVFVIASARDDFDPASVLFEFEGLRRDSPPSREKGKGVAPSVTGGPPFSRTGNERVETDAIIAYGSHWDGDEYPHPTLSQSLKFSGGVGASNQELFSQRGAYLAPAVDAGHYLPIAFNSKDYGNDASVNLSPTLRSLGSYDANGGASMAVAQPIPLDLRNVGRDPEKRDEQNRQGVGVGEPGDAAHTLTTACVHGVAQPIGWSEEINALEDVQPTLQRGGQGGRHDGVMTQSMAVRRLTPRECERLQGFPDDYTAIPGAADGPRYKALGNSWAVPVVKWIGERIARALVRF